MAQDWFSQGTAPVTAAPARRGVLLRDPYREREESRKDDDQQIQRAQLGLSMRTADRADATAARTAQNDAQRIALEQQRLALQQQSASDKLTSKERADAIAGYKSAQGVDRLVADLERLYQQGPGSTSGVAGLQDYLPLTINKRFDNAGNAARGVVGSALGFTGGQLNTATEAAMAVGPYLPQADDRDDLILDKINRLKQLANDARSRSVQILGGVPDANGRVKPVSNDDNAFATGLAPKTAPPAGPSAGGSSEPSAPPPTSPLTDNRGSGVSASVTSRPAEGSAFTDAAGLAMSKKLASAYRDGATLEQLNTLLAENGYQPFTDPDAISRISKKERVNFVPPQADDTRSAVSKAAGSLANGALGAYGLSAVDAATMGYLDEMAGGQTQLAKEYAADTFPGATFAGGVTGALAASTALGRGVGAASAASPVARALLGTGARGALTADTLYGAGLGSGENNDSRVTGALTGAASSVAGNVVGGAVAKALGAGIRGVSDPAVRYLTERGIPLSMGQTLGNRGMIGKTINKLESVPYLGDMLSARRGDSIKAFNVAAINDALEPLGKQVQGDAGQAAVGQAQDIVSQAYDDALNGVRVQADPQFVSELGAAMGRGRAVPVQGEQFGHLMDAKFAPLFGAGTTLDGPAAQAAFQTVRGARSQFGNEGAMGGLVADELGAIDDSIASLLVRQSPATAEGLGKANSAYAAMQPINAASTTAVNSGGVFSPTQLNRAVANNTKSYGGKAAAARGAKQTDLMSYAQDVLPSTVPNSGTVDRGITSLLLPAALGGSAYGVSDISPTTAAILAALAAGSTKTGGAALQAALVRRPDAARLAGQALIDRSRIAGALVAPISAFEASR